jgi:hypothetical protein
MLLVKASLRVGAALLAATTGLVLSTVPARHARL